MLLASVACSAFPYCADFANQLRICYLNDWIIPVLQYLFRSKFFVFLPRFEALSTIAFQIISRALSSKRVVQHFGES
ncbi:MAG: hypothetical protein CMR00_12510 [[Chlorobium] sp. 445]|nr:MAG: hypothetical protein CMR00_12510 [[Chlorobium] sp. 445]